MFDRDAIYHGRENKYQLVKDDRHFVVKPHRSKEKAPFVTMGDKSVINASRKLKLMVINIKEETNVIEL